MRLLVVEDDARIADFLCRGLNEAGFDVEVAASGEDGLAELEDRPTPGAVRERFVDVFGNLLVTRTIHDGDEVESPEELAELPEAAHAAITREAGAATIESVAAEQVDGRTVHAASWRGSGGPRELKVLDDGTVLSLELPLGALPPAITSLLGDDEVAPADEGEEEEEENNDVAETAGRAVDVERMLLDVWEVEASDGDMVRTALIVPTGEILGDIALTSRNDDRETDDD